MACTPAPAPAPVPAPAPAPAASASGWQPPAAEQARYQEILRRAREHFEVAGAEPLLERFVAAGYRRSLEGPGEEYLRIEADLRQGGSLLRGCQMARPIFTELLRKMPLRELWGGSAGGESNPRLDALRGNIELCEDLERAQTERSQALARSRLEDAMPVLDAREAASITPQACAELRRVFVATVVIASKQKREAVAAVRHQAERTPEALRELEVTLSQSCSDAIERASQRGVLDPTMAIQGKADCQARAHDAVASFARTGVPR